MNAYAVLFLVVLGVNLLPAFGPPTWTIIALYGLNGHLPVPAIVAVGACAASLGRFFLALAFKAFGKYLPARWTRNLESSRKALERRRRGAIAAITLFSVSPLPSAQLFEGAGLAGLRVRQLFALTGAFFVGRAISYTLYALAAKGVVQTTVGQEFKRSLTSPLSIALEFLMIGLLVLLAHFDWPKILSGKGHGKSRT